MLSTNTEINQQIINTIVEFHKTGELVSDPPSGVVKKGNNLHIDYGFNDERYGVIVIKRGQFEVIKVTNEEGKLVELENYNHSGKPNKTLQDYINALKCKNLNKDQKKASALIILSSESCRSKMVLEAVVNLFTGLPNFSQKVWDGLEFAFKNYSKTATLVGYNIHAGETPWEPLASNDYESYIISDKFTGDKNEATYNIKAVQAYIDADSDEDPVPSYPYAYALDACDTKEFVFEFSFDNPSIEACNSSNSRYVSYRLTRNDTEEEVFLWEGCLYVDKPEYYSLNKFPDEIGIVGTLQLFKNGGKDFIWLDVRYCYQLEDHFEGNILEIPNS